MRKSRDREIQIKLSSLIRILATDGRQQIAGKYVSIFGQLLADGDDDCAAERMELVWLGLQLIRVPAQL